MFKKNIYLTINFQLLIEGRQLLKVFLVKGSDADNYKSTLRWIKDSTLPKIEIELPAQLAVQLGMKHFYDVHDNKAENFPFEFDKNEFFLNTNLLCGLNCLKLNSNTFYPVGNYNLLKVRFYDGELSSLLKGEAKVLYKGIVNQFMIQKLSVKSVNYEILNEFDKPVLLHHCEMYAECKRNKSKL